MIKPRIILLVNCKLWNIVQLMMVASFAGNDTFSSRIFLYLLHVEGEGWKKDLRQLFTCGAEPIHQQGGPPYNMYIGSTDQLCSSFFIHFKHQTPAPRFPLSSMLSTNCFCVCYIFIFRGGARVFRNLRQNLICYKLV